MKIGVSTSPWLSRMLPRRALPSVFLSVKLSMAGAGQEHGVAIAEKSVALFYRVAISRAHRVVAGEGGNQHQQRRLGQMEVGDQLSNGAEGIARRDEEPGVGAACRQVAALRCRLQRAQAGGADRDHAAP